MIRFFIECDWQLLGELPQMFSITDPPVELQVPLDPTDHDGFQQLWETIERELGDATF